MFNTKESVCTGHSHINSVRFIGIFPLACGLYLTERFFARIIGPIAILLSHFICWVSQRRAKKVFQVVYYSVNKLADEK